MPPERIRKYLGPIWEIYLKAFLILLCIGFGAGCSQPSKRANSSGTPPLAIVSGPQSAALLSSVVLKGTIGLPLSDQNPNIEPIYIWRLTSTPVGSNVSLEETGTPSISFVPDQLGSYEFELVVSFAGIQSEPTLYSVLADRSNLYSNNFQAGVLEPFRPGISGTADVRIESGTLKISPGVGFRNTGYIFLDLSSISADYYPQLDQLEHPLEIAFSISNVDSSPCGACNNSFTVSLSSVSEPNDPRQVSYSIRGGGLVGDRFFFVSSQAAQSQFGPGFSILIDELDGLGTEPEIGAFRLRYEPASSLWSLFFEKGSAEIDPRTTTKLVGSTVDTSSTTFPLPYLVISSQNGNYTALRSIYVQLRL